MLNIKDNNLIIFDINDDYYENANIDDIYNKLYDNELFRFIEKLES
jgi:hypothetical protein